MIHPQLEEIPSRVKNGVDIRHLGGGWRRRIGTHELRETEDRIERRAKLMAHAGKDRGREHARRSAFHCAFLMGYRCRRTWPSRIGPISIAMGIGALELPNRLKRLVEGGHYEDHFPLPRSLPQMPH